MGMSNITNASAESRYCEPNLRDFLNDIWRAKFFILIGAFIGVIIAFVIQSISIPHYRASLILSPAAPMTGAESSSLLANDNLFALRFIAQRIGGGGSASDFHRFENIYRGQSVAEILLKDNKIEQGLKADKAFTFSDAENDWSPAKLSKYMSERVKLEPMGVTSSRRMVYEHADPAFAEYFISGVHHVADRLIRRDIREDSQARVDYLTKAIAETGNVEHRRALTTLLMEQERLLMLVSIDQPYAATVIEPAASGEKPKWPDLKLLYFGFAFLGVVLGFILHGLRRYER